MIRGCTKGKDCGKDGQDKPYTGQKDLSFFGTSSLLARNLDQNSGICIDKSLLLESSAFAPIASNAITLKA